MTQLGLRYEEKVVRMETSPSSLMKPQAKFYSRRTQFDECAPDEYRISEEFWINAKVPDQIAPHLVYCLAYGNCTWKSGSSMAFSSHNLGWSFEYIVEGGGVIAHDGITKELKAGWIFIHAPNRALQVRVPGDGLLVKRAVLLHGHSVDYFCNLANLGVSSYLEIDDVERVNRIYDRIEALASTGSSYLEEDISAACYSLIVELGRIAEAQRYPPVLRHAIRYIDCNLQSNVTLASLSRECRVNVSTLSRLFCRHLNMSPINYLISRRLEQARHLIRLKEFSFKEIADQCGYKRESFFSRAFKQRYGVSPDSYRRSLAIGSDVRRQF